MHSFWRILSLAVLAVGLALPASSDTVEMNDGRLFEGVRVETYAPSTGFMARLPQDGQMSELYDLPGHIIAKVEFREPADTAMMPAGRPALMTLNDGGQHYVIVESAAAGASGLFFHVRQSQTPVGGPAYDLDQTRVSSLDFTAQAPAVTPTPMPMMQTPAMPGQVPPVTGQEPMPGQQQPPDDEFPGEESDYYGDEYGGDEYDDYGSFDDFGGSDEMGLDSFNEMELEDMANMMGVGVAVFIAIAIGGLLFWSLLDGTVLYLLATKLYHMDDFPFYKACLVGAGLTISNSVINALFNFILQEASGMFCCIQLAIILSVMKIIIGVAMDLESTQSWQVVIILIIVHILVCGGCIFGLIAMAGGALALGGGL